ncbi:toxin-antitoxin system YwqK family antitoxin [Mucilaginibacter sp. FT3.2]|uniref:toxin-antitoxin system YwqK family antitoxin n=1 Tax=Mucilaginibacter sp. FT3.2 TaxID=2723090 RepID=UPI00160D6DEC|nr:hypothetical protein [Mucilaginibacter sp. FT3.2]MBB6234662.1 antitoxin component YwqK of YwqJK toxin-antitoxin module [Mucilaginibacter sp. FT3.2]
MFFSKLTYSQSADTIFYFTGKGTRVSKPDYATYYRIIKPPTHAEKLYDVQEYYKSGQLKRAGKSIPDLAGLKQGKVLWQGLYMSYYPNGNKERVANFENNEPIGDVVQYYPNGKVYSNTRYKHGDLKELLTCYDTLGNVTTQNGNGRWLFYYEGLRKLKLDGPVENGLEEGLWHGRIIDTVNITSVKRFEYVFDKGKVLSAKGYDSTGLARDFVKELQLAKYNGDLYGFIDKIKRHLGAGLDYEQLIACFTVEKDGTLSNIKVAGINDAQLDKSLAKILYHGNNWIAGKYLGFDMRYRVYLPLSSNMPQVLVSAVEYDEDLLSEL